MEILKKYTECDIVRMDRWDLIHYFRNRGREDTDFDGYSVNEMRWLLWNTEHRGKKPNMEIAKHW